MQIKQYLLEQNFTYCSSKKQQIREQIRTADFDINHFDTQNLRLHNQLAVDQQIETAYRFGHHIITCFDAIYPEHYKMLYDFPLILYANGNINRLNDARKIAIVGTRKPTYDAKKMCDSVAKLLAKQDYTIVSGLAFGTDALAHRGALAYGAPTIAVLASPVDSISPKSNLRLAESILSEGGLILSETPYYHPTLRNMYVGRNRLVSGISDKVFIVEGAEGSGSMTTASHALDQNKPLYAMPGSISNIVASGTNRLIQQGAYPVITADDLFGKTFDEVKVTSSCHPIIQCIEEFGILSVEALSTILDIPVSALLSELMLLECEEKAYIRDNNVYIV